MLFHVFIGGALAFGFGYWVLDTGYWELGILDFGSMSMSKEERTPGGGLQGPESGRENTRIGGVHWLGSIDHHLFA